MKLTLTKKETSQNLSDEDFAKYIDYTNLKTNASTKDIDNLIAEAIEYGFASICINPYFVEYARNKLGSSGVKIAVVVGFPLGANCTETKCAEASLAVEHGADEIDMVMNVSAFCSGAFDYVLDEINRVCDAGKVITKVIIETSQLTKEEVAKAGELVQKSKADFIKTSTGMVGDGARAEDIELLATLMRGKGIKASGGIRDKETALLMIAKGATRIGTSRNLLK